MKIRETVALVTGANRGLGLALAKGLVAAGAAKVYAAARDPEAISIPGVTALRLDVDNPEDVKDATRACGDVRIVINNAGISRGSGFLAEPALDAARAEMETNYFGPLRMARAFAPILEKNGGGAIVNVLSVLAWISFPQVATYSASKSAAWSLTNGLRAELREKRCQVVAVHVGYMDTDMTSHLSVPKSSTSAVAAQILAALEAGQEEVLADEPSRQVKAGLSAGVYLS